MTGIDELLSKMGLMIFLNTVTQFMNYCIDEKIEPTITSLREYIFKKTGKELDNDTLEVILKIALGNIQMAVLFAVNEASEVIAENMLDRWTQGGNFLRSWL